MFDASLWELMLILVIGLLVVGPERLPGLARTAGQWLGRAKRMVNNARSDIERELRAEDIRQMMARQDQQIRELKDQLSETNASSQHEIRDIVRSARAKAPQQNAANPAETNDSHNGAGEAGAEADTDTPPDEPGTGHANADSPAAWAKQASQTLDDARDSQSRSAEHDS